MCVCFVFFPHNQSIVVSGEQCFFMFFCCIRVIYILFAYALHALCLRRCSISPTRDIFALMGLRLAYAMHTPLQSAYTGPVFQQCLRKRTRSCAHQKKCLREHLWRHKLKLGSKNAGQVWGRQLFSYAWTLRQRGLSAVFAWSSCPGLWTCCGRETWRPSNHQLFQNASKFILLYSHSANG